MTARRQIEVTVNGVRHRGEVEPRMHLADFLRNEMALTGTHVGCEHGVCGVCTVRVDGLPVRSCLMLAVQADGCQVATIEGLGAGAGLSILQEAFAECHALQCGFCTPGVLMTMDYVLSNRPDLDDEREIREILSGTLCRCTGYQNIVKAVRLAARRMREAVTKQATTTAG